MSLIVSAAQILADLNEVPNLDETQPPESTITVGAAASILGISTCTVRRWAERGLMRYQIRLAGRRHHRHYYAEDVWALARRRARRCQTGRATSPGAPVPPGREAAPTPAVMTRATGTRDAGRGAGPRAALMRGDRPQTTSLPPQGAFDARSSQ